LHTQQLITQQALEAEREKDLAVRLARLAGVAAPAERISPDMPATVRYGDPNLAALYERQARNALLAEALAKLEHADVSLEEAPITSLREVKEIGPDLVEKLEESGIYSLEDLRGANDQDLLKIDGIGSATLRRIREQI
jgi:predicted flap endonuclease-1-like 5' DNA nuclease